MLNDLLTYTAAQTTTLWPSIIRSKRIVLEGDDLPLIIVCPGQADQDVYYDYENVGVAFPVDVYVVMALNAEYTTALPPFTTTLEAVRALFQDNDEPLENVWQVIPRPGRVLDLAGSNRQYQIGVVRLDFYTANQ